MAKANPLSQIAKKLVALQAKSAQVNDELKNLAGIVDAEIKKQAEAPAPAKAAPAKAAPVKATAKPAAKAAPAKTIAAPKKKGRPGKK